MGCCPGRSSTPTSPSCTTNCFRAKNITEFCDGVNSMPCGGTGSRDISLDNTNTSACSDSNGACAVTYQLVSYTSHFSAVTLDSAGNLAWTVSNTANANDLGVIKYRIYCGCNTFSAVARVYVCIENRCTNQLCPEDTSCNKCTGDCDPIIPNAILS